MQTFPNQTPEGTTPSKNKLHTPSSSYFFEQTANQTFHGGSAKLLMTVKSPSTLRAMRKEKKQPESVQMNYDTGPKKTLIQIAMEKTPHTNDNISDSQSSKSSHANLTPSELKLPDVHENGNPTRLKSLLKVRDKEIEGLQGKIQELQREVQNKNLLNRSYAVMNHDFQNSMNLADIEREDPNKQRQILSAMILQTFDTYKALKSRCNSVTNLVALLEHTMIENLSEYEFSKMKKTLEELAMTLNNTSKTEIELGLKSRENEKKNHEITRMNMQYNNLRDQHKHLQDQYNELKRRNQDLEDKFQLNDKHLEAEKNKNSKNEKQIEMLEKRIELILETDIAVDRDKLRKALTELVKENESLKRETMIKNKEIKKMKDEMGKAQMKMVRQNRKIETLSKNKKGAGSVVLQGKEGEKDAINDEKMFRDDDLNLLQQNTMPVTLDFRTSALKIHFSDLLNDIMDQGANVFVNQFNTIENMRDKKDAIVFVTNQLINFREFSDKLHFFLKEALELLKIDNIKDVQTFLAKYFRHVFNSQMLNLWIPDGITGVLYTTDVTGKEVRCLGTKGLLSDAIKNGKPFNKRHMKNSYICELTSTSGKYKVDNTLILPIKRANGRVAGAIEVSNIADSHFGFDEEYFGIALGLLVSNALQRINFQTILIQENRMKDILIESFTQLTASKTKYSLSKSIKECACKAFGVSTANFLFVENEKFIVHTSEKDFKEYETTIGLAGHVYKSQRGLIMSDVASSKDYNNMVDMVSLMPIYFTPILLKNENSGEPEVVGILQLLIKPKGGRAEEKIENIDEMLTHIGLDDPTENLVNKYCGLIANSIQIFRERNQKPSPA